MQVGTTKDQGLYKKRSAAVHPGALAAGTLPQINTIQYNRPFHHRELPCGCVDCQGNEVYCIKMQGMYE